ncbi:hypothetical protein C0Q57_22250 [Streptomyces albidoflavus]|nr:hypothetical protein C0Q57_22250 [Streptomyces albidoflavus]
MPVMKRPGAPRRGRLAIPAAVAALACLITAAPAQAAPPTAPLPVTGGELTEESRAVARAEDSGTPVEVASARTETGEVHAMPDGTLRLTQHAAPVRTRHDGVWKDIDTTLSARDGRVAPRSAAGDVSFSGGGDGPLAVLTDQGRSVELSWPKTLPAPVLQGNTATYRNVLDGVDLAVTAQVDGFSHVLVVHSAEAAADPALKEISYGLKGEGVTVERDTESNTLRALNPAGQELFATATPRMWDSGDAPARRSQGARSADTLSPVDPLAPDVRSAEVGMETSGSTLTLTPDPELLRGEETSYPVYIDPNFSGSKLAWTIAYDRHKNSSFWNGTNWTGSYANEARVGYESDTKGTSRAFFRLNSKELAGATVLSAQFQITNTYSWSCQARNVELWLTGGISASTTWNKQPSWATHLQTKSFAHGYTGCGAKSVDFNATEAAKRSAANGWANITLGLRASSESDTYTWKRFNSNPKIIVSYNRAPNTALAMETRPSTANDTACAVAPYVFVGNTDVTLRARVSDPDGDKVTARFHLWPTGKHPNDAADGVFVVNVDKTNITSGGWAEHTVSKDTLKKYEGFGSGGRFSWKVQARDAHSASDWLPTQGAPGCQFGFDSARPSALPQVSSPEFPGSGDGSVGAPARTPGSFTFTSGGVSDVVSYTYGLNVSPPTTKAEPATAGGPVTVRLTPGYAGPHTLYVFSTDRAGNRSDTQAYSFYADSPGTPDKPGDANGDGFPDLYSLDASGGLRLHPGSGGGGTVGTASALPALGLKDALVTRRGDWTADSFEDLVARHADGTLWLYPADGTGRVADLTRQQVRQFTRPGDEGHIDPATFRQLVSLGDLGQPDQAASPDFLAVIGDALWYLPGFGGGYLDEGYPLADSGWAGRTLVPTGDLDGDGRPDLLVRDTADGKLWLYRGRAGADGSTDPLSLADDTRRTAYGTGFTPAAHPLLAAPGDADGDGVGDLWTTAPSAQGGALLFHRGGTSAPGTPVTVQNGTWGQVRSLT